MHTTIHSLSGFDTILVPHLHVSVNFLRFVAVSFLGVQSSTTIASTPNIPVFLFSLEQIDMSFYSPWYKADEIRSNQYVYLSIWGTAYLREE